MSGVSKEVRENAQDTSESNCLTKSGILTKDPYFSANYWQIPSLRLSTELKKQRLLLTVKEVTDSVLLLWQTIHFSKLKHMVGILELQGPYRKRLSNANIFQIITGPNSDLVRNFRNI